MNFDKTINRKGTNCIKWDSLEEAFGRKDLIPLWIADMDFEVCKEISDAIINRANHTIYGYPKTPTEFWNAIIDWNKNRHNIEYGKEEICYMPGIVRGIAYIVNFFTQKGEKILIQTPVYHPFANVSKGNKRIVIESPLQYSDGKISMDFDGLEEIIKAEKPKLMILCNPHNPGGIIWDKESLAKVAHICAENGVIVISDEIHSDIELFGNKFTPFLSVSDEARQCGIALGAPSKTFNIPGIVSSWGAIKNKDLRKDFFEWMEVNEFSEPTMFVTGATIAAYEHGEYWLKELLKYLEDNILYVEERLKSIPGINPVRPQASFLLWLDCHGLRLSPRELDNLFIKHAGLALNNGDMFGKGGEGFMRMNIACPKATLEQALNNLEKAIQETA